MDYFFVLIIVITIAICICLYKIYQKRVVSPDWSFRIILEKCFGFSAILGFFCCSLFFIFNGCKIEINLFSFGIVAILAVIYFTANIFSIIILSRGSIAIYSLFNLLGALMLPFIAGVFFWNEQLTLLKIIGMVFLIISLFIPAFEKNNSAKNTKIFYILCIGIFILTGFANILIKYHQTSPQAHIEAQSFQILCDTIICVVNTILYFIMRRINGKFPLATLQKPGEKSFHLINVSILIIYALIGSGSYIIQLWVAETLDATLLFPLITGGSIIFTVIFGWIFFKEKPGKFMVIGTVIACIATALFLF